MRESLSHFRKSDEGAGAASTFGIEAATLLATVTTCVGFAGDAAGRLGVAMVDTTGVDVFEGVVVTVAAGRAVAGEAAVTEEVLPPVPTVVQTPVDCAEGII